MNQIPWLDSQVIRALLLAGAGVVGVVLSFFGFDEKLFNEQATRLIDAMSLFATAAGVLWAAYARSRLPNPPITTAAAQKQAERLEKERQ